MRKEGKHRAYRINCRPLYSAAWQGINFELKCNAMGWVGTGRNGPQFFDSKGQRFGQREELKSGTTISCVSLDDAELGNWAPEAGRGM